jgi:CelD/BcsL family acetyltransferase involved in cellulose biosynthesis
LPGAAASLIGTRLAGFSLLGSQDAAQIAAVVDTLAEEVQRRSIPVVEFEEIEEDSLLWHQLQRLKQRGFRFVAASKFDAHWRIRLPRTAEEYWGQFKSKTRYTLRKTRRKLGEYVIRRYTTENEIDEMLEAAHAVSLHSWQTHQLGLRIQADESEARYQRFLARQGAQRSYVLFRQHQPIAFVLSHQWRGVYHYDEVGFDRRIAELSPGNVLLQEILNDLFAEDRPELLDFGLGDARYKRQFANEQTRSATIRMFSPGMRGFWQTASLNLRSAIVRSARSAAARAGVASRIRRALRDRAASGTDENSG